VELSAVHRRVREVAQVALAGDAVPAVAAVGLEPVELAGLGREAEVVHQQVVSSRAGRARERRPRQARGQQRLHQQVVRGHSWTRGLSSQGLAHLQPVSGVDESVSIARGDTIYTLGVHEISRPGTWHTNVVLEVSTSLARAKA